MSLKMSKTLQLERPMPGMGLADLIGLIERNNEALQRAYEATWSDVHFKEYVYFTRQKRFWRLGPVPNEDDPTVDHFELQLFTGTSINDKSQWTNPNNWTMTWRSYGGADA